MSDDISTGLGIMLITGGGIIFFGMTLKKAFKNGKKSDEKIILALALISCIAIFIGGIARALR